MAMDSGIPDRNDGIFVLAGLVLRRIPEMNIPVPPFAKGGLGGIGFLPPLQFGLSIPSAPLLQRG